MYSKSMRNMYPSQCESIRTNPKKVFDLVVENHLKINPIQPKTSIWMNPNEFESNFQSDESGLGLI